MSEKPAQHYFQTTSGILYSYLICLPLLLAYEILILISQPGQDALIRISVDVWFKSIFNAFGLNPISTTLLLAALFGGYIVYKKRYEMSSIRKKYFVYMLVEALMYAVLISFTIGFFLGSFLNISSDGYLGSLTKLQLIALSLGAGLYEELFFRVILVSALIYLFNNFFEGKITSTLVAAIVAALIFSTVHYMGEYGDTLQLTSFLFRFLFGLALNLVYVIRGFGMAAWTHAIYDLIVIANT